jgi:oligopeptide/dipeptide ABC transporter ATP-binding protein
MNSKNYSNESLLSLENLSVTLKSTFGKIYAVRDASIKIFSGERIGIAGETGCGKTVTALSIMRLIPPPPAHFSGSIYFKGIEVLSLKEREARKLRGKEISMIFQEPGQALNPVFTIGSQLLETIRLHLKKSKSECEEIAIELLRKVGIPDPSRIMKSYPHELSGGMKQRAVIAIAISSNPSLLIADEPTTSLDVTIQAQIMELLLSLSEEKGLSMAVISHNFGLLNELTERIYVMYAGFTVESGKTADIIKEPLHPYTKALINAIPKKGKVESIPGNLPDARTVINTCPFLDRCPRKMNKCHSVPPVFKIDSREVRCFLYE